MNLRSLCVALVFGALLPIGIGVVVARASDGPQAGFKPATHRDLITWGPDEHGVVCYRQQQIEGIACVKVR
jgi:hypothetical protein